jgi:hypothetical protein
LHTPNIKYTYFDSVCHANGRNKDARPSHDEIQGVNLPFGAGRALPDGNMGAALVVALPGVDGVFL